MQIYCHEYQGRRQVGFFLVFTWEEMRLRTCRFATCLIVDLHQQNRDRLVNSIQFLVLESVEKAQS